MFRVVYTHHYKDKKDGYTQTKVRNLTKNKSTVAGATNLVYKVHASLSHNLVKLMVQHGDDEWVEYDMPWMNEHARIRARLMEIAEFHEVFYDDSHQG